MNPAIELIAAILSIMIAIIIGATVSAYARARALIDSMSDEEASKLFIKKVKSK